jgi:hypothetical protein
MKFLESEFLSNVMKEKSQEIEVNEYSQRADLFDRHLRKTDWRLIHSAMIRHSEAFDGIASMMLGVKPSFVFTDTEMAELNPVNFIPEAIRSRFITVTKKTIDEDDWSHSWVVDVPAALGVIRKYPEYFSDFDPAKISKEYMKRYILGMTTVHNAPAPANIKTGLLLGFPLRSVLSFSYDHDELRVPFDEYGFELSTVEGDVKPFKKWLKQIYYSSGMEQVLDRNRGRMTQEFAKFIKKQKEGFNTFTSGGNKYFEISYADTEKGILGKQLVLLEHGKVPGGKVTDFLNVFAKRYSMAQMAYTPMVGNKSGEIGVYFEWFHKTLMESNTRAKIAYLTLEESATDVKPGIQTLDRNEMAEWLKGNTFSKLASLITKAR